MKRILVSVFLTFGILTSSYASVIGFENGDFSNGLDGWTTSGSVDILNVGGDYGNVARLGANTSAGASVLAQTFTITPDTNKVEINFDFLFKEKDYSLFTTDFFGAGFLTLGSGGGFNAEGLVSTTHSSAGIINFSGIFDVSNILDADPNALLAFGLGESAGWFWDLTDSVAYVDNVSVSAAVPEPSTILLMGTALLGFGFANRKKKKA